MQARLSQHQNSESLRLLARRNLKTNIAHELLLLQALWWTNVIALELAFLHPISEEVESTVLPEYVLNNYLTLLLPNVAYMTLNGVNFPNPRFFATKCKTWVAEIVWKARWPFFNSLGGTLWEGTGWEKLRLKSVCSNLVVIISLLI